MGAKKCQNCLTFEMNSHSIYFRPGEPDFSRYVTGQPHAGFFVDSKLDLWPRLFLGNEGEIIINCDQQREGKSA